MSRPTHRIRRVVVALSLPLAVGALAGCSAGQVTQTATQVPTVDGANADIGPLSLRDVVIEYPSEGTWEAGSSPELGFVIANSSIEPDRLISIETTGADAVLIIDSAAESEAASPPPTSAEPTATATDEVAPSGDASASASAPTSAPTSSAPAETTITIPSQGLVKVPNDAARVVLDSVKEDLLPSQVISFTFTFEKAGKVTVEVPVASPESGDRTAVESFDFHEEPEHVEP